MGTSHTWTVHEVSQRAGVSVRTLHHYDAIGLLTPTKVTEAGYRLYDEAALRRLQNILLFRELQFPLKEIKAILDNPAFDPQEALEQQIQLLELQRKHLGELIAFAREIQQRGVDHMNFRAFDRSEIDQYAEEVKRRWGATDAYAQYAQKNKGKTEDERSAEAAQLMALFAQLGELRQLPPEAEPVQEKIGQLQDFITQHYYSCTDEILCGLGQMYECDDRMKHNIDQAGGEGTAAFANRAIAAYCGRRG